MVDVKAVKTVNKPVTLADIKANPLLEDLALVRQSRLSVVPVSTEHWNILLGMTDTAV
jgi:predicted RNA-binding protein with PUA-like domain